MRQNTIDAKAWLRHEVRAGLGRISVAQKAQASEAARSLLRQQRVWREAQAILFFAPTPDEVDLWPLLNEALHEGKIVALPRFVPERAGYQACQICNLTEEIQAGKFNIREPVARCAELALNRLDLILVPGVAFDLHGRRLGRGKGFYDQLLATMRGTRCGVAFEQQLVREVPVEPHDIHLNCILTPTRWIEL